MASQFGLVVLFSWEPTQRLNHRDSKKTIERDIEVFTRVTNSEAYSQT